MFIINQNANKKNGLQIFKLLGKWGALSLTGNATCIGFQYDDACKIFEDLLIQGSSYEILPGPTIRVSSHGNSIGWVDYFSRQSKYELLDEDSWKLLSPKGKKEILIDIVYQGGQYLLIDNETGNFIVYMSSLEETLQKKFLAICEKYHSKAKVSN